MRYRGVAPLEGDAEDRSDPLRSSLKFLVSSVDFERESHFQKFDGQLERGLSSSIIGADFDDFSDFQ